MALYLRKVPTVLSLSQLVEDSDDEFLPGGFCSPDEPISSCYMRALPSIVYPFSEGSLPNRARSFGGLSQASIAKDMGFHGRRARPGTMSSPGAMPARAAPGAVVEMSTEDSGKRALLLSLPKSSFASDVCPRRSTFFGGAGKLCASGDEGSEVSTDTDDLPDGEVGATLDRRLVDRVLVREWDRRTAQGLFRYDVTTCETKVTEGVYGFIAQLNEGRATKKRATEFRVDQVVQPYEGNKFNFTKAAMKEVLFQFTAGAVTSTAYHSQGVCTASPNLALINVSPIEYGHVLLVPRVNDEIPQLVDQTTMLFALQFVMEVHNPYFRLGYNSLGAFGTINHLHFQGYYLNEPYPVEIAPTAAVEGFPSKVRGVHVERLESYPVHGWVFTAAANVDSMAALVGALCMKLQVLNVPHNLLVCDVGTRVILWPQCFAEKQARGAVPESVLEMGVNPAAFEIAGHMVLKRREDYENLTQATAWSLLEQVSLTDEEMAALQARVFAGFV